MWCWPRSGSRISVVTATVLAIIAIVLSGASLIWQMVTWSRSGAVVGVTVAQSFPTYGADIGDPHVTVTAANQGRSAVTVQSWGLRLADGRSLAILDYAPWSATTPYRLEAGDSASWYVETTVIRDACARDGVRYQDLIGYVTLGDGRRIQAKQPGIGWK